MRLRIIVPTRHTIRVDSNDPTKCNADRCVKYRAGTRTNYCGLPTDGGHDVINNGKRTETCLKAEVVE